MSTHTQRRNGGFHSVLEADHPYVFIDSCMQIWPDADFANAHRHGVTAYAVTAWDPHATLESAIEELMYWHLVVRQHSNLVIAETAEDIRRAKRDGRAAQADALAERKRRGYDWLYNRHVLQADEGADFDFCGKD